MIPQHTLLAIKDEHITDATTGVRMSLLMVMTELEHNNQPLPLDKNGELLEGIVWRFVMPPMQSENVQHVWRQDDGGQMSSEAYHSDLFGYWTWEVQN